MLMARRRCVIAGVLSCLSVWPVKLIILQQVRRTNVISVRCYIKIRVTVLWDVAQCSLIYILVHVLKVSSAHIIRVGPSPELGNVCNASFKNAWMYASARSMCLLDVQRDIFTCTFMYIFD
jgi:hypothetical protein